MKEKTIDMTKGSPFRHILLFSIPLIIGNIFQQFYSMVDAIIVGRTIGVNALAAVGATGSISFFVIGFTMGLTNGFSIMISQRFGAKDYDGVRRSIAMGAMLSAVFAVICTLLSVYFSRALLEFMNTPKDIIDASNAYISVIFMGIPTTMLYNYMASVLRALGDSRTPLYFLLIASVLNIILDFVFILSAGMGTEGAAWATVISQGLSGILCLIYVVKRFPIVRLSKADWKFNSRFAGLHLRLGIPMAVQNAFISTGSMAVQTMLNGFGSIAVAGFTAATKIEQLVTQVLISFGITLSTFVGQNFGAKRFDRIREGVRKGGIIILAFSVLGSFITTVFGDSLVHFFIGNSADNITQVMSYARQYLNIAACFYMVLSCIFIFRSSLQGMGYTVVVLLGSILELLGRLTGAIVLGGNFGYIGVCFAGPMAWTNAAILFIIVYVIAMKKYKKEYKI